MVYIYQSTIIHVPIEELWAFLRDFNHHDKWHPAIKTSAIEANKNSTQVSAIRNFQLNSGEKLREQLLSLSDQDHSYTYTIVTSEIPLFHYIATVQLRSVSGENKTFWSWECEFEPPENKEKELTDMIAKDVYLAGFEAVRSLMK